MRNKNAQNNGKDGEYGEGKGEKEKRTENHTCNFVETALAACNVSTICNLADYLQVYSTLGMDDKRGYPLARTYTLGLSINF